MALIKKRFIFSPCSLIKTIFDFFPDVAEMIKLDYVSICWYLNFWTQWTIFNITNLWSLAKNHIFFPTKNFLNKFSITVLHADKKIGFKCYYSLIITEAWGETLIKCTVKWHSKYPLSGNSGGNTPGYKGWLKKISLIFLQNSE